MKITGLKIKGFGKLQDKVIDFSNGINVVYGKNEAGKSTTHSFIKAMLFGISKKKGRKLKRAEVQWITTPAERTPNPHR